MGLGDVYFFIALAVGFPTGTFVVLLSASLVFSWAVYQVVKKKLKDPLVPLAGFQALFLFVALALNSCFHISNLYPPMNNANYTLATDLKQLISTEQAHHYRIVPLSVEENKVVFWTAATAAENTASELQIVLGKKVQLFETSEEELQRYLRVNYRQSNTTSKTQLRYSEDFLVKVLQEAQEIGSSDVHFEIFKNNGRVRFRIDGKLIERYLIELKEYPILVNRIKIMAQLDISEKRLPQDGRIHRLTADGEFDIRVSVLPTLHGEKMVLRILTKENNSLQLDHLGFGKKELKRYREGLKKPQGMVLISGPTGSGKTTTLYATLKQLNKLQTNILTIEDPIEYTLEGINQVALKERIGLDFPNALRTFLRQDPDIIMVGEIRDPATRKHGRQSSLDRAFGPFNHPHQLCLGHHFSANRHGHPSLFDRQHPQPQRRTTPDKTALYTLQTRSFGD